jgi:hypothetical protein
VVTFVGPGGSGKTRLALQVAAEQLDEFPNGVFWVPLQGVAETAHFPWWQGGSLMSLAETALGVGRLDDAHDALLEGLPILARLGDRLQLVWGLAMPARTLAARGHEEAGGVCWGALEAEENRGPIGQWETARHEYEQELAPYEGAAFEQGRDRGRQLSVDEAVAHALSVN